MHNSTRCRYGVVWKMSVRHDFVISSQVKQTHGQALPVGKSVWPYQCGHLDILCDTHTYTIDRVDCFTRTARVSGAIVQNSSRGTWQQESRCPFSCILYHVKVGWMPTLKTVSRCCRVECPFLPSMYVYVCVGE